MRHETHLPTQHSQEEEEIRISRPDENRFWPESDQSTATSGQKNPLRLTFPKARRLRTRREFKKTIAEGTKLVGPLLCIDCRKSPSSRLGITASSRYGKAVERNRFKRLIREAFRQNAPRFSIPCECNVIPRKKARFASFRELKEELLRLLSCMR